MPARKARWKGKDWYQIITPAFLGDIVIGESPATDPAQLKGRIVEASLAELTGDPARYFMKFLFKIKDVAGTRARTEYFGHEVTRDFIARAVQIRTARIDTNDVIQFKDGKMRLKAIVIANRPIVASIRSKLARTATATITTFAKGMSREAFIKEMAAGSIQTAIKAELNKIYPVRLFEFRASRLL
jgi:small subunit ribosomal protein S3Ae